MTNMVGIPFEQNGWNFLLPAFLENCFVTEITPDETTGTIAFKLPFKPDVLTVCAANQTEVEAFALDQTNNANNIPSVVAVTLVPIAEKHGGKFGGVLVACRRILSNGEYDLASYTQRYGSLTTGDNPKLEVQENGNVAIKNLVFYTSSTATAAAHFPAGKKYIVFAAKYE